MGDFHGCDGAVGVKLQAVDAGVTVVASVIA